LIIAWLITILRITLILVAILFIIIGLIAIRLVVILLIVMSQLQSLRNFLELISLVGFRAQRPCVGFEVAQGEFIFLVFWVPLKLI
jgi:hypothetical protein